MHPYEKRRFSIAEVKRLCSFPDDFVLKGTYGQQWERLGNSVPPVMMMHIASAMRDGLLNFQKPTKRTFDQIEKERSRKAAYQPSSPCGDAMKYKAAV